MIGYFEPAFSVPASPSPSQQLHLVEFARVGRVEAEVHGNGGVEMADSVRPPPKTANPAVNRELVDLARAMRMAMMASVVAGSGSPEETICCTRAAFMAEDLLLLGVEVIGGQRLRRAGGRWCDRCCEQAR